MIKGWKKGEQQLVLKGDYIHIEKEIIRRKELRDKNLVKLKMGVNLLAAFKK